MTNIQIIQINKRIENGWAVKADTERFGEKQILFEGSYDECWHFIKSQVQHRRKVGITVYGTRFGTEYQNIRVMYYPSTNEYDFIGGIWLPRDLVKLRRLIAC